MILVSVGNTKLIERFGRNLHRWPVDLLPMNDRDSGFIFSSRSAIDDQTDRESALTIAIVIVLGWRDIVAPAAAARSIRASILVTNRPIIVVTPCAPSGLNEPDSGFSHEDGTRPHRSRIRDVNCSVIVGPASQLNGPQPFRKNQCPNSLLITS